jgi:hypothetical protein
MDFYSHLRSKSIGCEFESRHRKILLKFKMTLANDIGAITISGIGVQPIIRILKTLHWHNYIMFLS